MQPIIDKQRPEYHLNLKAMDTTHQEFMDLVNLLGFASKDDFKKWFNELVEHTEKHFQTESDWMQRYAFAAIAEHEGEHRRVINDLKHLRERVNRGALTMARAYIREQLPQWFHLHATTMDSALASHLLSQSKLQDDLRTDIELPV